MAAPKIQNDFPLEVLHRIFDKLPFQRKITCEKVCKAGSKVALASCNESLVIRGPTRLHYIAWKLHNESTTTTKTATMV